MLTRNHLALSSLVLTVAFSCICVGCSRSKDASFNESNTAEIKSILKELDTSAYAYRFVLPVIRNNKELGSEVVGTLSVAEIERIASSKNIRYTSTGSMQIVLKTHAEGSDPSSHPRCTACSTPQGQKITERIQELVKNIPGSKYTFIK